MAGTTPVTLIEQTFAHRKGFHLPTLTDEFVFHHFSFCFSYLHPILFSLFFTSSFYSFLFLTRDASFEELWKHFKLSDEEKGVMTMKSHVVTASKQQAQFSILLKLQTNRFLQGSIQSYMWKSLAWSSRDNHQRSWTEFISGHLWMIQIEILEAGWVFFKYERLSPYFVINVVFLATRIGNVIF